MEGHEVTTLGERLSIVSVELSWDTEHFELKGLSLGDGLEMANHSVVTLEGDY